MNLTATYSTKVRMEFTRPLYLLPCFVYSAMQEAKKCCDSLPSAITGTHEEFSELESNMSRKLKGLKTQSPHHVITDLAEAQTRYRLQ